MTFFTKVFQTGRPPNDWTLYCSLVAYEIENYAAILEIQREIERKIGELIIKELMKPLTRFFEEDPF